MKIAPGYRICHAARYQSRLTLAERVQVFDSTGWRPASADELMTTRSDNGGPAVGEVSVIAIPKHLLKRWWSLAESGDGDLTHITAGFESYAREIAEYFNYKNWVLPPEAVVEVVVSDGERKTTDVDDATLALQPSRATRFSGGVGSALAYINLGEENVSIVLGVESGEQSSVRAEIPARIRLILEPGEGVMLPAGGIFWNRSTLPSSDLDVSLLVGLLSPD